jgi:hypothetical protein
MKHFEVDFTYKIEEYGVMELDAEDTVEAENIAIDMNRDLLDFHIDGVREIV